MNVADVPPPREEPPSRRGGLLAAVALAALAAAGAVSAGWPRDQATMGSIVILAGTLWVTEAIPAFATALIVIAAEIALLTGPLGQGAANPAPSPAALLASMADPVLLLFLGGLVMAQAAAKEGVDLFFGAWLLRPFAGRPSRLLVGVIAVTALFSMWMSNTATTAFMLTIVSPILAQVPRRAAWRKGLVLAVPFAASIGGMSTPIASPPNAIALGYLERSGHHVSFAGWMAIGGTFALLMHGLLALLLLRLFPPPATGTIALPPAGRLGPRGIVTVCAFVVTVLLWLTEGWHGQSAAVVSVLPVAVLLVAGVIGRAEIARLEWDVLILIAGGLALGWGILDTGLDQRIAGWLPLESDIEGVVLAAILALVLGLGTFLSNTAVTNLVLPVAAAATLPEDHKAVALAVAFTAALTMALPVSGPPNAMAYARGELRVRDMFVPGMLLGLVGAALVLAGVLLLG